MEISKLLEGNKVTVKVNGRIDSSNYMDFQSELDKLDFSNLFLVLDFTDVSYITSAGLRVLLVCRKRLSKESMVLLNVNSVVYGILDTSGFTNFFTFKQTHSNENLTFIGRLENCVEDYGTEKKLFIGTEGYSWFDIDLCSDIVASDLAKRGVRQGSHVAICSPNSINWIIAFFAIQKLHALAVFVNFTLKPSEIKALAKIGDITHFCYGFLPGVKDYESFLSMIQGDDSGIESTYSIMPNIDFRTRIGEMMDVPAVADFDSDDPSFMIFTSGSTNAPKGVLYSSANIMESTSEGLQLFKMVKEDRICLFLPMFHIFGFATGLVASLISGCNIYIPANTHPETILSTIYENKCTVFHSIPTMFLAIIKTPGFDPAMVSSVRCSYMGGAPITSGQMQMLMNLFPNNHFGNIYGMSEKQLISLTDYNDTAEHITQTVGKPVPGIQLKIRELGSDRICKTGEIGEIVVKSDSVLTAYYKLDISKQALDAEGWLPTGDLGFLGEDGYLRITGRCKELIIRAGENISPNEISSVLCELDEVSDAKVFGAPDEILGEKVVAAVAIKEGCSFDENKTKEFLLTKLAKAKIPEIFVVYDRFPLLGTGKVDGVSLKKDVLSKI